MGKERGMERGREAWRKRERETERQRETEYLHHVLMLVLLQAGDLERVVVVL
jgi:hypothetical protein